MSMTRSSAWTACRTSPSWATGGMLSRPRAPRAGCPVEAGRESMAPGAVVEEVDVDPLARDLAGQAAPLAVKVVLPLGQSGDGAALRDLRVGEGAHPGEFEQAASEPR